MPSERMRRPVEPADYLNIISRAVFSAGLSWAIVDGKWDAFEERFHGFDPERVARMSGAEIDALMEDTRLVRSRGKFAATVQNANALLEIAREAGSVRAWLDGFASYAEATKSVHKRFKYLSKTFGAYYFLYIAGAAIPDFPSFEIWSETTGEAHPRMRELVQANEGRPVGGPTKKPKRVSTPPGRARA